MNAREFLGYVVRSVQKKKLSVDVVVCDGSLERRPT